MIGPSVDHRVESSAELDLPRAVTRAASTQTFLTIRFLVKRSRRQAAFCAYAYFRWVDDILDAEERTSPAEAREERLRFVARQRALVESCLMGHVPTSMDRHEAMLVDLLQRGGGNRDGLETYVRQMMQVMEFDARRRGSLVTAAELDEYTGWLATAVTEAMHHFLGDGGYEPLDDTRYLAVTGAHILHMLRDTHVDLGLGYVNVPRELLDGHGIQAADVESEAYRGWVRERVELARSCLAAGRTFFDHVESWRFRLAGLAYIARFEWLLPRLEADGFAIRPTYARRPKLVDGARAGWGALVRPSISARRATPA